MLTTNLYVPDKSISAEAQVERANKLINDDGPVETANVHYHKYGESCNEQCRSYPSGDYLKSDGNADGVGESGSTEVDRPEDAGSGNQGNN